MDVLVEFDVDEITQMAAGEGVSERELVEVLLERALAGRGAISPA